MLIRNPFGKQATTPPKRRVREAHDDAWRQRCHCKTAVTHVLLWSKDIAVMSCIVLNLVRCLRMLFSKRKHAAFSGLPSWSSSDASASITTRGRAGRVGALHDQCTTSRT